MPLTARSSSLPFRRPIVLHTYIYTGVAARGCTSGQSLLSPSLSPRPVISSLSMLSTSLLTSSNNANSIHSQRTHYSPVLHSSHLQLLELSLIFSLQDPTLYVVSTANPFFLFRVMVMCRIQQCAIPLITCRYLFTEKVNYVNNTFYSAFNTIIIITFQTSACPKPVLLVVSLAGIKVLSPDGKVIFVYFSKSCNISFLIFYFVVSYSTEVICIFISFTVMVGPKDYIYVL